jgi:hypothetical protein
MTDSLPSRPLEAQVASRASEVSDLETTAAPTEQEALRADAARYRWLVGVWGFTIAEDLFGITTGRNVSVDLDAAIDESIAAHKQWRPK